MDIEKKTLKAHLIKYREPQLEDYIWFWINPTTGNKISGDFLTQEDAETWFREMVSIYDESVSLIKRAKDGKFFFLEAIMEEKISSCPFKHQITSENDGEKLLSVSVLAMNLRDAKKRVEEFFKIKEWKELKK